MADLQEHQQAQELAQRVWMKATPAEREALIRWLQKLALIRDSGESTATRSYYALKHTLTSDAVWPLVKVIWQELKRMGWDERTSKWKAFLGGAAGGFLIFGSRGAGIAALGGAIGVPLWLVVGGGVAVLDALIDASKATPPHKD